MARPSQQRIKIQAYILPATLQRIKQQGGTMGRAIDTLIADLHFIPAKQAPSIPASRPHESEAETLRRLEASSLRR